MTYRETYILVSEAIPLLWDDGLAEYQIDAWNFPLTNMYTVGDIHGCLDQLQRLVELCEQDAGAQRSTFILLGDYIDRGPTVAG